MNRRETSGKQLLKNTIRSTDAHNKITEQEECWRLREKGRSLSPLGRTIQQRLLAFTADPSAVLGSMKSISRAKAKKAEEERKNKKKKRSRSRSSSRAPKENKKFNKYLEKEWESPPRLPNFHQHDDRAHGGSRRDYPGRSQVSPGSAREEARRMKLDAIKRGNDRWDHSGFQDMYPTDYQENQNQEKINERRQQRINKNQSSGTDSRSSSSSHSRSRSRLRSRSRSMSTTNSPAPSRKRRGLDMIGPTPPPSHTSIQKRLMEHSNQRATTLYETKVGSNGHSTKMGPEKQASLKGRSTITTTPVKLSTAKIQPLMDIPIQQSNSTTGPDEREERKREKVKLRFKEGRRPRMAIRAKLPEDEPELGPLDIQTRKPATASVATMTPGVVTMNTKMTKSLRKALKKKQREKEMQEQLEKQRREEKLRHQEEEEAGNMRRRDQGEEELASHIVNGDSGAKRSVEKSLIISSIERSLMQTKTTRGDELEKEQKRHENGNEITSAQPTTQKAASSYWDYLDDLDEEDLGLKAKGTSDEEEEEEESNRSDTPDVVDIAIQPPKPIQSQRREKRRDKKRRNKKRLKRKRRRHQSLSDTTNLSDSDSPYSSSGHDRDGDGGSSESEEEEKRRRRRHRHRHRSSKHHSRRHRTRKDKGHGSSRGRRKRKSRRKERSRSKSRLRSTSRSRTRSSPRPLDEPHENGRERHEIIVSSSGGNGNRRRSRSISERVSRSRSRERSGSARSRSRERSGSARPRGRERSGSVGSRSRQSGSARSRSRQRSESAGSESSRYSDFVRQSFKEVLMEK